MASTQGKKSEGILVYKRTIELQPQVPSSKQALLRHQVLSSLAMAGVETLGDQLCRFG